jgi:hypothetical protein
MRGRLPKYPINLMKAGDRLRLDMSASKANVVMYYWRKHYGVEYEIVAREGNRLLEDHSGRYVFVTIAKPVQDYPRT